MNRSLALLLAVVLLIAVVSVAFAGGKGNPNPGVSPPNAKSHGLTYGEWGTRWWAWVLSIPQDQDPIDDTTGQLAALGQSGPVWFLAGSHGGVIERTCTVPAGKALFFPLVNIVDVEVIGDPHAWTAEYALWAIAHWIDAADSLSCTVDGVQLQDLFGYRGAGSLNRVTFAEPNMFGLPGGLYGPLASDGYWIMLAPLPPGRHEIHFGAHIPQFDWTELDPNDYYLPQWGVWDEMVQDVTYHLTVAR